LLPRPTLPAAPKKKSVVQALKKVSEWVNLFPFIAIHLAVAGIFFVETTWTALILCAVAYSFRVWALTAGFHRYFAHRSYKTSRWFQFVIGSIGSASLQRGPIWWAGEHRHHHRFSDHDGDPHSPIKNSVFWSHVGWVMARGESNTDWQGMRDWAMYPELKWLDRFHWIPGALWGVATYAIGGWPGVFWGFFLSTVLVYHVTFCVNSVCHLFGYRRYQTTDMSRNNWIVAILTFGEGWHNNHHHYQSSARQGFAWYEIDISYISLRVLSWFGIVWDVREPTERAKNTKLISETNPDTTFIEMQAERDSSRKEAATAS